MLGRSVSTQCSPCGAIDDRLIVASITRDGKLFIHPMVDPMLHKLITASLLVWVSSACSGGVTSDGAVDGPESGAPDPGATEVPAPASTNVPSDPTEDDPPVTPGPLSPSSPGEVTRLARLTHTQYTNTTRDLFGIEDALGDAFPPDALNGFEFTTSLEFAVDSRLAPLYQQTAEELARRTVSDGATLGRVVPCTEESETCRDEFIDNFGTRAFRRPLQEGERSALVDLFAQGATLVGGSSAFKDGVQVVVEALMQSPYFLYRTEMSNATASATVPLTSYEVASRLSYLLYDSMPDSELFAAAAADELSTPEGVVEQVTRLVGSPRVTERLVAFHEQAWQFGRYTKISPDPNVFPDLPADLATRLADASHRFVSDIIEQDGGLTELLTAPFAYADEQIAPLYGAQATGGMQRIDLDPATRKGLLSQVGFLASHAHAQKTDPIHRGLFVTRDLLCRSVGTPPPGASQATLPPGTPAPRTTREEVTLLTAPTGCVECHRVINPPGFAFEGFDAVGQVRTEENEEPIDAASTVVVDNVEHDVNGAVELIGVLAQSEEVRRCYATKWLTFAHGRKLTYEELDGLERFTMPMSVRALVTTIATDAGFLSRPTTESLP